MSTDTLLEERLATVEAAIANLFKEIAQLKKRVSILQSTDRPINWLQQITGSFKDEPAFEEALVYGIVIRKGEEFLL